MNVAARIEDAWAALAALPPLRDEAGLLVLEEADDDTRTAALRYRGATITATLTAAGEATELALAAPALDAAALEAAAARLAAEIAAAPAAEPAGATATAVSPSLAAPSRRVARLAAAGLAVAGAAVLVARRRR